MTSGKRVGRKAAPPATTNPSVRTLILGIDRSGRIVQHDRTAPKILAQPPGDLLGVHLSDITSEAHGNNGNNGNGRNNPGGEIAGRPGAKDTVAGLLEAVEADRESSGVLTVNTAEGTPAEAIVTMRPMRAGDSSLAALVTLQIPAPVTEQYVDPAVMRTALLHDTFQGINDALDFADLAGRLMDKLVPHFCAAGDLVVLESLVGDDEFPTQGPDGNHPLRRLAVQHSHKDLAWQAAFPAGEILRYPAGSPYVRCIESGIPVLEPVITPEAARQLSRAWRRKPVAKLLSGVSMLVLPLVSKDTTLGFFCCIRAPGTRRFDAYDMNLGMEFATRAAGSIDNARRYNREHATALTLQRSMLPTGLSAPSSVEVRHRYLPGSKMVEVGGDWYESIRLPGARVALVVGDVAGHGVRAAVTMGRLRTAIQTLAMLELPPAESLEQLNELMRSLGENREPHFATCAYAVYDAVSGDCELAIAGHLPPLLVHPSGVGEMIEVTPAPPLGVGGVGGVGDDGPIGSYRFPVEDGSLFVLYTDGLVESKDRDITDGLERLKQTFEEATPSAPLEDLCKASLRDVYEDSQRDDIAVLIAKLRRIPEDNRVCWTLTGEETSVRQARMLIRDPMKRWGLEDLIPVTELLVSELVTNAVRYGSGGSAFEPAPAKRDSEIRLRLILEGGLVCEVHDSSTALPRVLQVDRDAENGRGLHVVSQLAERWGARRTPAGKVVWCEQHVATAILAAAGAVPVAADTTSMTVPDSDEAYLEIATPIDPLLAAGRKAASGQPKRRALSRRATPR